MHSFLEEVQLRLRLAVSVFGNIHQNKERGDPTLPQANVGEMMDQEKGIKGRTYDKVKHGFDGCVLFAIPL